MLWKSKANPQVRQRHLAKSYTLMQQIFYLTKQLWNCKTLIISLLSYVVDWSIGLHFKMFLMCFSTMSSAWTTEGNHQLARTEGNNDRNLSWRTSPLCKQFGGVTSPMLVEGIEGYLLTWSSADHHLMNYLLELSYAQLFTSLTWYGIRARSTPIQGLRPHIKL